jgi:hypothetical protein
MTFRCGSGSADPCMDPDPALLPTVRYRCLPAIGECLYRYLVYPRFVLNGYPCRCCTVPTRFLQKYVPVFGPREFWHLQFLVRLCPYLQNGKCAPAFSRNRPWNLVGSGFWWLIAGWVFYVFWSVGPHEGKNIIDCKKKNWPIILALFSAGIFANKGSHLNCR